MDQPRTPPQTEASPRSAKYQLVEAKLGKPLDTYLLEARKAGVALTQISYDLATATGVSPLTPEVVRRWVRQLEMEAGVTPSVLPGHEHHSLTSFEQPAA